MSLQARRPESPAVGTADGFVGADTRRARAWAHLAGLTLVHAVIDLVPGVMHAALPAFQEHFDWRFDVAGHAFGAVAAGGWLLGLYNLTCNGVQVLTGHWRADKDRPVFQQLGLVLCMAVFLAGVLPQTNVSFVYMVVLALIGGWGVGLVHPEAMRAIHALDISSSVSTGFYMAGGIVGFAAGSVAAPALIRAWGLDGLYVFFVLPVIAIAVISPLRLRLARDGDPAPAACAERAVPQRRPAASPFWQIMLLTTLAGITSAVLTWILPQRLYAQQMGGLAVMAFMLGGGIGAFVLGCMAHRWGEVPTAVVALAASLPLLMLVIGYVERPWVLAVLFAVGFFGFGAYPLMVSLARRAVGPGLGRRMGLIVGGVWGIACLSQMVLGPVADRYGPHVVLQLTPFGFIAALVLGVHMWAVESRVMRADQNVPGLAVEGCFEPDCPERSEHDS